MFLRFLRNISQKDFFLSRDLSFSTSLHVSLTLNNFPYLMMKESTSIGQKVAWHDASWRFISLDRRQTASPNLGTIPFLKLFPNNALVGGRLFSVATGFMGLTGMITLLFLFLWKKSR